MSAIPKWFLRRLQILESLKFAPAKMDMHWQALKDIPEVDLQHAVDRAARECDEFPSPKMLRAFVTERRNREARADDTPRRDASRETPISDALVITFPNGKQIAIHREWKFYCDDCHDRGWLSVWCGPDTPARSWLSRRTCDRKYEHYSHEHVILCPCILRNPDMSEHMKAKARAAAKGE